MRKRMRLPIILNAPKGQVSSKPIKYHTEKESSIMEKIFSSKWRAIANSCQESILIVENKPVPSLSTYCSLLHPPSQGSF